MRNEIVCELREGQRPQTSAGLVKAPLHIRYAVFRLGSISDALSRVKEKPRG